MGGPVVYGMNPDVLDNPERTVTAPPELSDDVAKGPSGELLRLAQTDPAKAAKKLIALWVEANQSPVQDRREAQWKANRLRREGIANVRVVKSENEDRYTVWAPPGSQQALPMMNHAATLCRKLTANLLADPPAPDPIPSSGEAEDRDRAEFAERVLLDLMSESQLNEVAGIRRAVERGHLYGSGFRWYYVDPQGGGRKPMQVLASPEAVRVAEATRMPGPFVLRYVTPEQDYQPPPLPQPGPTDPYTGQPTTVEVPQPPERTRLLTDDPAQADLVWVPRIRAETMTGRHLRPIPHVAEDIWDADGVLKASFLTLSEVRKLFPQAVERLSDADLARLVKARPEGVEKLLPPGVTDGTQKGEERLVFTLTGVWRECPAYPDGAYVVALGDVTVGYAAPWVTTVNGVREALDLPVTQYKGWDEGRDDFFGVGTMEILGPANEGRAAQIGSLLTHLDRFNHRKIFLPTNSIVQPKQFQLPTATVIPINPGGKPEHEEVPAYPKDSLELFGLLGTEMDNSVSLSEVAQGLNSPEVQSGRHAYQIVAQAHAGLSEPKQNIERGYERGCRIILQLVRAFYTVPQRLRWATEDGQHRERWWVGSDLGSTVDVQVKPGTMTMLTPAARMALAQEWGGTGLLAMDQVQSILFSGVGPMVGVQDDAVRLRIRRQLSRWGEGPPPDQPDPAAWGELLADIFEPVEADSLPAIAQVRLTELARFQSTVRYQRWPMEWRVGVQQEFVRMQMVVTPPQPVAMPDGTPVREEAGGAPVSPNPAAPPLDPPRGPAGAGTSPVPPHFA